MSLERGARMDVQDSQENSVLLEKRSEVLVVLSTYSGRIVQWCRVEFLLAEMINGE